MRERYFIDMDGTLCEFRKESSLKDLYQPGYFLSLKPFDNMVSFVRELAKRKDVYILSCYLADSVYARAEKEKWLDTYLSDAPVKRILIPCGCCKAKEIEKMTGRRLSSSDILLDDYTPNLFAWDEAGGRAIKFLNGINNTTKRWAGPVLSREAV